MLYANEGSVIMQPVMALMSQRNGACCIATRSAE
jgi:hypothetical protein